MNTRHVPDLEHCQEFDRLCKEKGIVMPETEFYWHKWSHHEEPWLLSKSEQSFYKEEGAAKPEWTFPAPLVSEQGEWLSNTEECISRKEPNNKEWRCGNQIEGTEANARMKCLNYLLAEGIVTVL